MSIHNLLIGRSAKTIGLGFLCLVGSFAVGVETAGEVEPIGATNALSVVEVGDVDGSGVVDLQDVIQILEVTQGYREAKPHELQADPTGDGRLTVDDALQILQDIAIL